MSVAPTVILSEAKNLPVEARSFVAIRMQTGSLSRRERRAIPHRRQRGFTLLEMLLASVLLAMLLTAILAVFSIYSRLFDSGGKKVARAQLAAALERQLTDDLRSAIEDSPREQNPASSSGPVRRFSLVGTASTLRFDVLQTLPEDQLPTVEPLSTAADLASGPKAHVPELKTVAYRFVPKQPLLSKAVGEDGLEHAGDLFASLVAPGPGLSRWEIGFETPLGGTAVSDMLNNKKQLDEINREPSAGDTTLTTDFEDLMSQTPNAEALTWLPEVRSAAFRYFDGSAWSDQWNSLQQGSLPVAVEVTIRLQDLMEKSSQQTAAQAVNDAVTGTEETSQEASNTVDQAALKLGMPGMFAGDQHPECRFLIRLTTARKRPTIKTANSSSPTNGGFATEQPSLGFALPAMVPPTFSPPASPPPGAAPPGLVPPPWPSGGRVEESPDASRPDQWMRTMP
jgi:prepilin-type N-terminal cleavage/methylation domain-containing protein